MATENTKIRLLFVWHAAVTAGNQKLVKALADFSDLDLHLLIPQRWDESTTIVDAELPPNSNFKVIIDDVKNPFKGLKYYFKNAGRILNQVRPDVILAYEEPYSYSAGQLLFLKQRNCPKARFAFYTWQNINCRYSLKQKLIERYVFRHSDLAIAGVQEVKDVLLERGFSGPIAIAPLGQAPEDFPIIDSSQIRNELGLTEFTIGFVGRPAVEKGVTDLFDALAMIKDRPYQVLFVGSGREEAILRKHAVDLGIMDRIVWVQSVENRLVHRYLQAMDVVAVPSRTTKDWKEQFGRVPVEAMICRVPVIVSDSAELPRTIGDAGLVARECDPSDLKDKIVLLMDSAELRSDLAKRGYEHVMHNYTWKTIAGKIHDALIEVCRGKR